MKHKTLASVALAAAALLASTVAIAADGQADWVTTLNVKLVLLEKLGADSLRIDVDTVEGALTLTGTVHKRETRELAETVAGSVSGVTSVENELRVEAAAQNPDKAGVAAGEAEAEVKDAVLATKVRLALVEKLGADGFKIGTEVASGVVTLEFDRGVGAVRRQEATRVVRDVDGVTKVVSIDKNS